MVRIWFRKASTPYYCQNMSIANQLTQIKLELPATVTLVAVSKTKPNESVIEAYKIGQRVFGENRIQELISKSKALPKDIEWHMIGHLQSKKVKLIAPFISMIHSIDSAKLLDVVNEQATKINRVIDVLLQFHIAQEDSKFGLSLKEAEAIICSSEYISMTNIRICGVMGMATFTKDEHQVRSEFKSLKSIFDRLKQNHFSEDNNFSQVSMGMSGDYKIAIKEGSTMIRVGSTIFGERH